MEEEGCIICEDMAEGIREYRRAFANLNNNDNPAMENVLNREIMDAHRNLGKLLERHDNISGVIDTPAEEPAKYEPSKLYWHEALDRSHVACDHFHEHVQNHPAVEHDAELKEAAEKVVDVMRGFYQLVGSKYWEFEKSCTP